MTSSTDLATRGYQAVLAKARFGQAFWVFGIGVPVLEVLHTLLFGAFGGSRPFS